MKERLASLVWRGALFHACHRQVAQSSQGFDKKQRHLSTDSEARMKGLFTKGGLGCRNMSRPTEAVGLQVPHLRPEDAGREGNPRAQCMLEPAPLELQRECKKCPGVLLLLLSLTERN